MKLQSILTMLMIASIEPKTVTLVAPFCPQTWPGEISQLRHDHQVFCFCPRHVDFSTQALDFNKCDKAIFFDINTNTIQSKENIKKSVLVVAEARNYHKSYYDNFHRVYTWDDQLVDGRKFFKFYYPYLCTMKEDRPSFKDKKFMCLVSSNWVPHRVHALSYFYYHHPELLDVYGTNVPNEILHDPLYKGGILGHHSCEAKFDVMKNYKYCLCFENTLHTQGYITEKIFACFRSGCVPIYLGADNITQYIPKGCFIDLRDFKSYPDLLAYLNSIHESEYEQFLENVRNFLKSEQAFVFSIDYFNAFLEEAVDAE